MFLLKKLLGAALMPLPLALALLTLGLLFMLRRKRLRGWVCAGLGWAILAVAANRGVATALTAALERAHPPAPALIAGEPPPAAFAGVAYVVVLGSGHGDAPGLSAGQRLSPSARARLMEGVRLVRGLPDARLLTLGPVPSDKPDAPSHARVLADAAVELGVERERILEIDSPRDTAEETAATAKLIGPARIVLVTSAWHMPRALTLADRAGLRDILPAPADHLGGRDASIPARAWITWNAEALTDTTRGWRELLGRWWTSLGGS